METGRNQTERGLIALVSPHVVVGRLVASGTPHSSLVLGSGALGLCLGGSRAFSLIGDPEGLLVVLGCWEGACLASP